MPRKQLPPDEAVGLTIAELRRRAGLTQEDVRQRLQRYGVTWSRPTAAHAESGRRPLMIRELYALGEVFGVAPDLLLYPPGGVDLVLGDVVLDGRRLGDDLYDRDAEHEHDATKGRAWADATELYRRLSYEERQRWRARDRDSYGAVAYDAGRARARQLPERDEPVDVNLGAEQEP